MLASLAPAMENRCVAPHPQPESDRFPQVSSADIIPHFRRGAVVIVALHSPREKLFGSVIALASFGLVFSGIQLDSFEDFVIQLREGEAVRPSILFLPMHRVERIELDRRSGEVPALAERFELKTGLPASQVFSEENAG